jgi:hypothetical protein
MPVRSKNADAASAEASVGCLVFFALFWSGLVLTSDGVIGWAAIRQIQAMGFATAPGHVTQSSLESHPGSKGGRSYSPKITYTYQVAGKDYQNNRYRYGELSGNDSSARRIIDAFPVGGVVNVYYSPNDPANSVLVAGLQGSDLFIAMFLTPFNFVMLGMWWLIGGRVFRRFVPVPAGGAKIVDDGFTTRIRMSSTSPLAVAAGVVFGMSFIGVFPIGFAAGFNPPMQVMYVVWPVILIVAFVAYLRTRAKVAGPDNDLVIDESGRHLLLPATFGRTDAITVPLNKARAIEVEQILQRNSKGRPSYRYAPTLVFADHDGIERREKLAEWSSKADSNELVAWLRERLRLTTPTQADAEPK